MSVCSGTSSQSGLVRSATSSATSSAGAAARAAASAASTSAVTWPVVLADPETEPVAAPTKETTTTSVETITPLVVSVLLAQRRLALLRCPDDHDAVVGGGRGERVLDQVLGGHGGRHQLPASSFVLRMRTPRKSAVGQPWLTAATWPGCALPQLKAPPSTQVSGPPTASMEPQKSVVVAW